MSTINGTDVSVYNAAQHNVTVGHLGLEEDGSSWQKGVSRPFLMPGSISFKELSVTYIVKGYDREDIIKNTSDLLAVFNGIVILKLDGFTHYFRGTLKDHDEEETAMHRWHKVKVRLDCYEYGHSVTRSGTGSVTIRNPGNVASPCIVTVTPTIGMASMMVTGVCRDYWTKEDLPVVIGSTTKNSPIILDGLNGEFTENGSLKEMAIWGLPSLEPGKNTVSCENANIKVECIPIYM